MITYEPSRLQAEPGPAELSWRRWRNPDNPDEHRPVLVIRKGRNAVIIGPSDIPSLDDALTALEAAWSN